MHRHNWEDLIFHGTVAQFEANLPLREILNRLAAEHPTKRRRFHVLYSTLWKFQHENRNEDSSVNRRSQESWGINKNTFSFCYRNDFDYKNIPEGQ